MSISRIITIIFLACTRPAPVSAAPPPPTVVQDLEIDWYDVWSLSIAIVMYQEPFMVEEPLSDGSFGPILGVYDPQISAQRMVGGVTIFWPDEPMDKWVYVVSKDTAHIMARTHDRETLEQVRLALVVRHAPGENLHPIVKTDFIVTEVLLHQTGRTPRYTYVPNGDYFTRTPVSLVDGPPAPAPDFGINWNDYWALCVAVALYETPFRRGNRGPFVSVYDPRSSTTREVGTLAIFSPDTPMGERVYVISEDTAHVMARATDRETDEDVRLALVVRHAPGQNPHPFLKTDFIVTEVLLHQTGLTPHFTYVPNGDYFTRTPVTPDPAAPR